jgi:hypothetical protein
MNANGVRIMNVTAKQSIAAATCADCDHEFPAIEGPN